MELKAGIKIHGYTLEEFISNGATAEVWRIKDDFGIEKALKIFSPVQKVDDNTLDLLIDEFKLLYRLDHPNILKSEIMGAYLKVPYIIMPYYNSNLAAEMNKRSYMAQSASPEFKTWFSEDECVTLMQQIGGGLAYLHQQGIIHQDVKPENILFDSASEEVHYVLTDFGISTKIKENIARMTLPRNQAYALTPAYAAPEQFNGRLEFKSDVFSLGVLLFEMCEGRLPFTRHGYAADSFGNIARPEFRNAHLSGPFKNMILSALTESPDGRPEAREFEDYAIRSRGNTITQQNSSTLRTDKITVLQPMHSQAREQVYLPLEERNPKGAEIPLAQTIRVSGEAFSAEYPRQNSPTLHTPVKRGGKNGFSLPWVAATVVLLGALLFGYLKYRQGIVTDMVSEANNLFESGQIKEANGIYTKLAERKGDEEYYAKKFLTDRILAESYDEILQFKNDRAPVKKQGKWGFIDKEGKLVIECQYIQFGEFQDKTVAVCKAENEWGIIDLQGVEKTPFKYKGSQSGGSDRWVMIREEGGKRISENFNF